MQRKKLLFVYNPKAGKGKIKTHLAEIIELFSYRGYEVTICPTQKKNDAKSWVAERSKDYKLIVCSGGDGTLDEVVTGMMLSEFQTPIGYIPTGSTNDFGESLHLPKTVLAAAEIAVDGVEFPCDLGTFNKDFFVYIAAFGMFTQVSYETDQDIKNMLGHMAYVLEGAKRLSSIHSYRLKVTYEDQVIEDDFMFGMITNSISVGGYKHITGKNVVLDDGVFEVTLIKMPKNMTDLNKLIASFISRDIDTTAMYCFRTDYIQLESLEEIPWTLDGEYGGNPKKVVIENKKQAIIMKVDKK